MSSPRHPRKPAPAPGPRTPADSSTAPVNSGEEAATTSVNPSAADASVSKALTAEEQMALYEKELKESDWGHQPC